METTSPPNDSVGCVRLDVRHPGRRFLGGRVPSPDCREMAVRDRATRAAGRERARTARGAAQRLTLLPLAVRRTPRRAALVGLALTVGLMAGGRGAAGVMGWGGNGAWAIAALVAVAAAVVGGALRSLLTL
jgi:hypothetical protein